MVVKSKKKATSSRSDGQRRSDNSGTELVTGIEELKKASKRASSKGKFIGFTEDGTRLVVYFPVGVEDHGLIAFPMHDFESGKGKWEHKVCTQKQGRCVYCKRGFKSSLKMWALTWNIEDKCLQVMRAGNDLLQRLLTKHEKLGTLVGMKFEVTRNGTSYLVEEWPSKKMGPKLKALIKEEIEDGDWDLPELLARQVKEQSGQKVSEEDLEDSDLDEEEVLEEEDEDEDEDEEDEEGDEEDLEEDEEELDEEDEEDEEEEPPVRQIVKKKAATRKKRG